MEKKEPRTTVLYARIKKSNLVWLKTQAKHHGFKSFSEFVDATIGSLRGKVK